MNLSLLENATLGHGPHRPGTGHCFAELLNLMIRNEHTDRTPECLTRLLSVPRRLNDSRHWRDDGHRTVVMLPFVARFAKCTRDDEKDLKCMYALADYAVRVIAADAMERLKLTEQASILRALPAVVDRSSAIVARDAARKSRAAAAAAAYAYAAYAYAASDAAYAAYAASAAAYADADAAAAAADAASDADARRSPETIERHTQAMLEIICTQYGA